MELTEKALKDALEKHILPHLIRENERYVRASEDLREHHQRLVIRVVNLENRVMCPRCKRDYE
jgi:hypothetical protein